MPAPQPQPNTKFYRIADQALEVLAPGMRYATPVFDIYGYMMETDSTSTRDILADMEKLEQGYVPGWWFSRQCPFGEWGWNLIAGRPEVEEITREQFLEAKERDFC